MSDTIDRQLEHLAELHAGGALTDDEFAAAKATALVPPGSAQPPPPATPPTPDPILAAPRPSIPSKLAAVLILFASLMIGLTITGMSGGFEWAPAQAPAAPIVCAGGELVARFDVAYTVNTKGVDFASVCVKDGEARAISGWWLATVMTIEYTVVAFAIVSGWRLLWLRKERRHESLATWSSEPGVTSGGEGVDDA
jgi:Short C-terminal domain